jgi:hypothetical protein
MWVPLAVKQMNRILESSRDINRIPRYAAGNEWMSQGLSCAAD